MPAIRDRVSHVLRLGGTLARSVLRTERRSVRTMTDPVIAYATAASLKLIHQQQVIVAGQREVIMRGRKRSRLRRSVRGVDAPARPRRAASDADAPVDASLRALARLLARQAAREVFERTVRRKDSDHSFGEGRE